MNDPAICLSVLGSTCEEQRNPGIVNWCEGGQKMIAHIPFYILHQMEGVLLLTLVYSLVSIIFWILYSFVRSLRMKFP